MCRLCGDLPVAFTARTVEHDQFRADTRIAASGKPGGVDVRHHREIHVQRLPLGIDCQGVDPRNALDLVHRILKRLEAVRLVHRIPLLQDPIILQVGITQTEGKLIVPVQPARPLHHRTECGRIDDAWHRLQAAIRLLHVDTHLLLAHGNRLAIQHVTGGILRVELQAMQREVFRRVDGMAPSQMLIEADIDQRQARQRRAHHIKLAGDGQVHLIKAQTASPWKMRIGQQHAAPVGGQLAPYCHCIAAALQGKTLVTHSGQLQRLDLQSIDLQRLLQRRRRGTRQRFGELPHAALDQQATGQTHQIVGADGPNPLGRTGLRQALGLLLIERAVVSGDIALHQLANRQRLRIPEIRQSLRRIEPLEQQIAGHIVALFKGRLVRPEIARALAIDGDHLIGQQAQVILRVGVTDAVAQTALIGGNDMRHARTGTPDLGPGRLISGLNQRLRRQNHSQRKTCKQKTAQGSGHNHADSNSTRRPELAAPVKRNTDADV